MKLFLSPTKTMVFDTAASDISETPPGIPRFEQEARELIQQLALLNQDEIQTLFKTSEALTQKSWDQIRTFDRASSAPALFVFRGEAFKTLAPDEFTREQLEFAQANLFILSGLYGILTPMDAIRPYRLDLNTPFRVNGNGLKAFWKERVGSFLKERIDPKEPILNLASDEYASLIKGSSLSEQMITLQFRQREKGRLKNIAVRAKQNRGIFTKAVIENLIQSPDSLKEMTIGGYAYSPDLSSPNEWFFIN